LFVSYYPGPARLSSWPKPAVSDAAGGAEGIATGAACIQLAPGKMRIFVVSYYYHKAHNFLACYSDVGQDVQIELA